MPDTVLAPGSFYNTCVRNGDSVYKFTNLKGDNMVWYIHVHVLPGIQLLGACDMFGKSHREKTVFRTCKYMSANEK